MNEINAIENLLRVCDQLLAPDGCPWDREQTMLSARTYVLEEVCELIEAIDLGDNKHIEEELGDLFYNAIFLGRLAEKEGRCRLTDAVNGLTEKLVRRHPHVFGEMTLENSDEVIHQWDKIKLTEASNAHRKSALDGIPKGLPALSRAYKMQKRFKKADYSREIKEKFEFDNEDELGDLLWDLAALAEKKGLDPEHALKKVLSIKERDFRENEVAR